MDTWAIFHENENFVLAIGHPMPCGINEVNDVGMPFQDPLISWCETIRTVVSHTAHHDVDFFLDLGEQHFVRNGNALEDMMGRVIHRCRGSHEIDVREAT